MPSFILTPNLRIVNRYLTNSSDTDFDEHNPDYVKEELELTLEWSVFNNEAAFVGGFKQLLLKYRLNEHFDNLLYLLLSRFDDIWSVIQHHVDNYESKKRAKELASLLILLKQTPPYKVSNVTFKPYMGTTKIDDAIINQWISDTLIKAIESKNYPLGQFGTAVMQMLTGEKGTLGKEAIDLDKLKAVSKQRLINPKNKVGKGQFDLCLAIYNYLENETNLVASDESVFSDSQLNFLFDLLEILKQWDRDNITSDPKDYMRTFLMNHLVNK